MNESKILLVLLIFSSFLHSSKSQCLISIDQNHCAVCSSGYYEQYYYDHMKLGYMDNIDSLISSCIQKQNSTIISRKILVLNRNCSNCNFSEFDANYDNLAKALQSEIHIIISSLYSQLEIFLQDGNHYIIINDLKSSGIELFRRFLSDIVIKPLDSLQIVKIIMKTDEFFFFISKSLTIENIIFEGLDIVSQYLNDTSACYNQIITNCCSLDSLNKSFNASATIDLQCSLNQRIVNIDNIINKYGLFNVEYLIDSTINPLLTLINCTFNNLITVHSDKGFSSLLVMATYSGNAIFNNLTVNNSFFENSLIYYTPSGFDQINKLIIGKAQTNPTLLISLNESIEIYGGLISYYNSYMINNNENTRISLINIENWNGLILMDSIEFYNISFGNQVFYIKNDYYINTMTILSNITINSLNNMSFLNITNLAVFKLIDSSLSILSNTLKDVMYFQNIDNIIIDGLSIRNASFGITSYVCIRLLTSNLNIQSFFLIHANFYSVISFTGHQNLTMNNCTFRNITFNKGLISFSGGQIFHIYNSFFNNITGNLQFFDIFASDKFVLVNVYINNTIASTIYSLATVTSNINYGLIVLNSILLYIWQSGELCRYKYMTDSLIQGNIISNAVYISPSSGLNYFIINSTTISNNNSTASFFIKIIGYANLTNLVMINNFFTNVDKYQFLIEFVNNVFYMYDCYLEDNGVLSRKAYYLDTSLNDVIVVWLVQATYFARLHLIASDLVELGSGFMMGNPHNGYFEVYDSEFIIRRYNPNFTYKGILLDHITGGLIRNCSFYNILCNTRNYMNSQGGIIFTAATSYHYIVNEISIEFTGCKFINCSCDRGGALVLLSMTYIKITGCNFQNSTAKLVGGHMLIAGSKTLLIENTSFTDSIGAVGSGMYIFYSRDVKVVNGSISNAISSKDAVMYFNSVKNLTITNYTVFNTSAGLYGGCLYLRDVNATIQNIYFKSTSAMNGGSIASLDQGSLIISESYFNYSVADSGGAIYLEIDQYFEAKNCYFTNTSTFHNGAAIYIGTLSLNLFENLFFEKISSFYGYGIISVEIIDSNPILNWQNITNIESSAHKGSFLYFNSASNLKVYNIILVDNDRVNMVLQNSFTVTVYFTNMIMIYSGNDDRLFQITGVELIIDQLTLYESNVKLSNVTGAGGAIFAFIAGASGVCYRLDMKNNTGDWVFYIDSSEVSIFNSSILNNIGFNRNLAFLSSVSSVIDISNVIIEGMSSDRDYIIDVEFGSIRVNLSAFSNNLGVFINAKNSHLYVNDSSFINNSASDITKPNDFYTSNLDPAIIYYFSLRNCKFHVFSTFSIFSEGSFQQEIFQTNFSNENTDYSKIYAIYSINPMNFTIINSIFTKFTDNAIKMFTDLTLMQSYSLISIINSNFTLNQAFLGGAIYFNGTFQLMIKTSNFTENSAFIKTNRSQLEGYGGAIYFQPDALNNNSLITINNCTFMNNSADYLSPTVFSLISIHGISSNKFINNKDNQNFTDKMFSLPITIKLIETDLLRKNGRFLIKSGSYFHMKFLLIDDSQQTLIFDNSTLLSMKPDENEVVLYNFLMISNKGIVYFQNLMVKVTPDSNFSLSLEGLFLGLPKDIQKQKLSLNLLFYSLPCDIGEILKIDKTCFQCLYGTYSLIDPMKTEIKFQKCNVCPDNGECASGYIINPVEGYYRMTNSSSSIVACQNPSSCLGVNASMVVTNSCDITCLDNINLHGECEDGSFGNLCFYCKLGHGKFDKNDICWPCGQLDTTIYLRFVILVIIAFIYIIFQSMNNKFDEKNTLIKMIITHSQHISIILVSAPNLPLDSLTSIFSLTDYISFSQGHVISNDCIFQQFYYDADNTVIAQEIMKNFFPMVFSILSCFLWISLLYIWNHYKSNEKSKVTNFLLKLVFFMLLSTFMFYPIIMSSVIRFFDCMILDSNSSTTYLRISPNLVCWSTQHLSYVLFYGVPGILFWGFFFPFALYGILKKITKLTKRINEDTKNLHPSIQTQIDGKESKIYEPVLSRQFTNQSLKLIDFDKFKFFSKDFKDEFYFWECLIFIRKFVLSIILNIGSLINEDVQMMLVQLTLLLSLLLSIKISPFKSRKANLLDVSSLIICVFCAFSSFLFNSHIKLQDKQSMYAICFMLNICFYCVSILWILPFYIKQLRKTAATLKSYNSQSSRKMSSIKTVVKIKKMEKTAKNIIKFK